MGRDGGFLARRRERFLVDVDVGVGVGVGVGASFCARWYDTMPAFLSCPFPFFFCNFPLFRLPLFGRMLSRKPCLEDLLT